MTVWFMMFALQPNSGFNFTQSHLERVCFTIGTDQSILNKIQLIQIVRKPVKELFLLLGGTRAAFKQSLRCCKYSGRAVCRFDNLHSFPFLKTPKRITAVTSSLLIKSLKEKLVYFGFVCCIYLEVENISETKLYITLHIKSNISIKNIQLFKIGIMAWLG